MTGTEICADGFVQMTETVLKRADPDFCDLEFLQDWLQDRRGGDNFLRRCNAAEGTAWDSEDSTTYMTLSHRGDRFAAWISNKVLPVYHNTIGHKIHMSRELSTSSPYPIWDYKEHWFAAIAGAVCTILSSVLPCTSIIVLYIVRSMLAKLLLVVIFSCLFSLAMSLVSSGRRYEVFAATTAFAAVQVVFITGIEERTGS